jgi:transcriptional regulator with XRE-family HTH domain
MFYRNIRNIRKGKGITQVQLAEAIGVKRPVISKYESGAVPLTVEQLQKIATALDVPLDYIIGDADVKSSLSWTETSKVLLATPYRVSSLNSGETVSGSAKTQICDYLNCSFRYLLGGNDEHDIRQRGSQR